MNRKLAAVLLIVLTILVVLIGAPVALASGVQTGSQCTVAADQLIPGNLNAVCPSLVVDGTVTGDLVAVGGDVTINGTVQGDLTAIARQVTINGTVEGDVRTLAVRLRIAPGTRPAAVRGDITGIGLSSEVQGPVSGDFLFAGYQAILDSPVGGSAAFYGSALAILAPVQGNADVTISRMPFQPPNLLGVSFIPPGFTFDLEDGAARNAGAHGTVKGNLRYDAPVPINVEPGTVGGAVHYVPGALDSTSPLASALGDYGQNILRDLLGLMVVGMIALIVAQNGLVSAGRQIQTRWGTSFGYGLLALLLFIPASFLLILVSIAILGLIHLITLGELTATALIILAITNLLVIGGFLFVVAFLARLVVCYVIGRWLGRYLLATADRVASLIISLLLGVLAYAVITNLGAIGLILSFVAVCFGLGGIILAVRDNLSARRQVSPTRALTVAPNILPVPLLPSGMDIPAPVEDIPLGMDNLPEGFTWFDS